MSKLMVYDTNGASVGDVDMADVMLDAGKGRQAVHDAVVAEMAAGRAGTASTKTKAEVAGSGAKPWKQKGTGRARAGYRQSPVWRGGGVAFGPKPRSYAKKLNRKVGRLAFRRAFQDKVEAGDVRVIEGLSLEQPKTRQFVEILKAQGIAGSTLLLLAKPDRILMLSARNIPKVAVMTVDNVSVTDVVRYKTIIVERTGVDPLLSRLQKKAESRS